MRRAGNAAGAIAALEQAAAANPEDPGVLNNLGVALRNADRFDEAAGRFMRALELRPNDVQTRLNLAITYRAMRDYPMAALEYEQVVAADPSRAPAWYDLGVVYQAMERSADAVRAFEAYANLVRATDPQAAALGDERARSLRIVAPAPRTTPAPRGSAAPGRRRGRPSKTAPSR